MTTVHGDIETPVFMNVGTVGAIKGAVSSADLEKIGCDYIQGFIWGRPMEADAAAELVTKTA